MMESSLTTPYHCIAFPLLAFYDLTLARRVTRQVIITSMSEKLLLMFVQSLFQFDAKGGNRRAITGRKSILTCPSYVI